MVSRYDNYLFTSQLSLKRNYSVSEMKFTIILILAFFLVNSEAIRLEWHQFGLECSSRRTQQSCESTNCTCMWCNILSPHDEEWKCGSLQTPIPCNCQQPSYCSISTKEIIFEKTDYMMESFVSGVLLIIILLLCIVVAFFRDLHHVRHPGEQLKQTFLEKQVFLIAGIVFVLTFFKILYNFRQIILLG